MKNFLLKTKGNYSHSDRNTAIRKFAVVVAVAFLILYGGRGVLAHVSAFFTLPIYSIKHYFEESSGTIPVFYRSRIELENEIKSLQQEVAEQQGHAATLAYVMEENSELRGMLSASTSPRILAGVVSQPPHTPYDTMIIDRGSLHGIQKDAPVFFGSDQAIGYVQNVFDTKAQVTLFSSSGVKSSVYILGSNIFTTAYGEGGGVIRLSVPQGINIKKDSVVILPSLERGVLGTIDVIQSIATEPEQHAYVTLRSSLQSIRLVSVGSAPIMKTSFSEAKARVVETESSLLLFDVPQNYSSSSSTAESSTPHGTTSTSSLQ